MTSPAPSVSSKATSRTGRLITSTARKLTAPASTFFKKVRGHGKKSKSQATTSGKKRRRVTIEDEDSGDESSNGDVLPSDSLMLLTDAEPPASSQPGTDVGEAISIKSSSEDEAEESEEDVMEVVSSDASMTHCKWGEFDG
jgi:hypothetical protein